MATIAQSIKEEVFTPDLIRENESLKTLSDDQVQTVVTLGNNLVADRIGKKTGETLTAVENDVREAFGQDKLPGEKYFEYIKRAIAESRKAGDKELTAQLQKIKEENDNLAKQAKSGNVDEVVKKQLSEYEVKLKDKDGEVLSYKEALAKKDKELEDERNSNKNKTIDQTLDKKIAGLTFLKMPDVARDSTIALAKQGIKNDHIVEVVPDGKGGEKLLFRDKETKEILKNPANSLEPVTEDELLRKYLKEIIDPGRKQTGSGSQPPAGGSNPKGQFYLSGAKTQVEADEMIVQHLVSEGVSRTSKEFSDRLKAIRDENKVSDLPIK